MSNSKTVAKQLLDAATPEWNRAKKVREHMDGNFPLPYAPQEAGGEFDKLAERSVTNMLSLVVDMQSQMLFVEGYSTKTTPEGGTVAWDEWQRNHFDSRQIGVHREALTYGRAYVGMAPNKAGVWRPIAFPASRMWASFDSVEADPWPEYAVSVSKWRGGTLGGYADGERDVWLFGPDSVAQFVQRGDDLTLVGEVAHGFAYTPIVMFANRTDLDGNAVGQVEPLVGLNQRLNQAVFDLMMTSTFSSFKVKTLTGVFMGADDLDDDELDASVLEAKAKKFKLSMGQNRVLMASDPEAKFGQLDETPLAGFISSVELAVRQIATVSQVPPHALLGSMSNLSAESLAAAESGLQRKVAEIQHSFGESWEQLLRLMAFQAGAFDEAEDTSGEVMWRDMSARSLSQSVDAWGKAAQMLALPAEVLWRKIPGLTESDITKAKAAQTQTPQQAMVQQLFGKNADDDEALPEVDSSEGAGDGSGTAR